MLNTNNATASKQQIFFNEQHDLNAPKLTPEKLTNIQNEQSQHSIPICQRDIKLTTLLTDKNTEFNEVVRRIKPKHQKIIAIKLADVTQDELQQLQNLCQNFELILSTEKSFFLSVTFPYIALKALEVKLISVAEFASLQTWHAVFNQQLLTAPHSQPKLLKFINEDDSLNQEAWAILTQNLTTSTNLMKIKPATEIITKLQNGLISKRKINNYMLLFKILHPLNRKSMTQGLIDLGFKFFALYKGNRIAISLDVLQMFFDINYGNNACKINFVIGASSTEDIRNGNCLRMRDYAIPFPYNDFPTKAHGYECREIFDFQLHEFAHAYRVSVSSNQLLALYTAMGDALTKLKIGYNQQILKLKSLITKKLNLINDFKLQLAKMSDENKLKAEKILFNEFYCLAKIFLSLEINRKAIGQLRFEVYDAAAPFSEQQDTKILTRYTKEEIWLINIIVLLSSKCVRSAPISALTLKLAGKIMMRAAYNIGINMQDACENLTASITKGELDLRFKDEILNLLQGAKYFFADL